MDFKSLIVFSLKIICDASSRLIIVGAWMYTTNSGNFSTSMALGFYYTLATVNFLENFVFSINNNEDIVSFRNITGKREMIICICRKIHLLRNYLEQSSCCLNL